MEVHAWLSLLPSEPSSLCCWLRVIPWVRQSISEPGIRVKAKMSPRLGSRTLISMFRLALASESSAACEESSAQASTHRPTLPSQPSPQIRMFAWTPASCSLSVFAISLVEPPSGPSDPQLPGPEGVESGQVGLHAGHSQSPVTPNSF